MELLQRLAEAPGIPGREEKVSEIVKEALKGHVDEIRTDVLGNVIALKSGGGDAPRVKVMIAAHMDEIGFFITHIDEKTGFLRIDPVGGFDPRVLIAQRVVVHSDSGDYIGVMGTKPVHLLKEEEKKKAPEIENIFIDLGISADAVKERVRVGDSVTLKQDLVEFGELVSCKALDDRVGIYVMIEALRKVREHEADIYLVATTQEEVGIRGARVSSFGIAPDIGIAVDVTVACDIPGVEEPRRVTRLGEGVAIKVKDSLSISNPHLVRKLREIAEEKGIKYQMEVLPRGGTDAGALQLTREGAAAATISIPTRYIHSVVESAHKKDIQAAIDLLAAFLEVAHEGKYTL
ncbi:M42 family metallopeptidase [Dehalococcoidia bacterium]|nr:M42 family metallopeptidase [Dehalococcoidia bacterium]MCL0070464.1 M42 family metallopeptidase [Dehalococcoidia bacterium]